ncbi:MAG: D-alanyl-D-alanine carboxypeptidase [Clostridia bacterium]|nr:D-alanyl-D-alanine carboxypeptidase [Clostridia bacterium]
MKKLTCFLLILALLATFAPLCYAYTPDEPLISECGILMNLDDDETVLFAKDAEKRMQPSTLSKIMTAVLAIESAEDISKVNVTCSYAGVHALDGTFSTYFGVKEGEVYSLLDLVSMMMLTSANDAANVIAVHVGGSVNAFVNKMNEKVKSLELENTFFLNPTGLDADGQYTTARDMAKITKHAMTLPLFQQIVKNVTYEVPKNKTHKQYTIYNDCELIPTATYNQYAYEYATGVKSGATEASGYCVSATAQKDGITYVCVVMGGKKTDIDGKSYTSALVDARRLFRWAFNNFKMKAVSTETTIVAEVPVRFSTETDHVSLVPEKTITSLVPKNVDESTLIIEPIDLPKYLNAPIEKGTFVCKAKVIHAEEEIMQINLVAYTDVDSSFIMRIFSFFGNLLKSPIVIIVCVLIIAAAAVLLYRYLHKKKRLKRQKARIALAQKSEEPRNNDYRDKFSSFKDDLD